MKAGQKRPAKRLETLRVRVPDDLLEQVQGLSGPGQMSRVVRSALRVYLAVLAAMRQEP